MKSDRETVRRGRTCGSAVFFIKKARKNARENSFGKYGGTKSKVLRNAAKKKLQIFRGNFFAKIRKNHAAKQMQKNAAARTVGFGKNAFSDGFAVK